jgi:hypothetical protein
MIACAICTHFPHCEPAPKLFLSWRILPTPSSRTARLIALSVMPRHMQTYIEYLNNSYANKNNCYSHKDQAFVLLSTPESFISTKSFIQAVMSAFI